MCCAVMPGEFLEGIGAGNGANMEVMIQHGNQDLFKHVQRAVIGVKTEFGLFSESFLGLSRLNFVDPQSFLLATKADSQELSFFFCPGRCQVPNRALPCRPMQIN